MTTDEKKPPRDLMTVINQILAMVPAKEKLLHDDLAKVKVGLPFVAPEVVGLQWARVQGILATRVGPPDIEWKKKVVKIWNGK